MQNSKLIGVHNSIQYFVRESDGVDYYYSLKSNKTAMSIRGIARMLGCQHNTLSKISGKLGIIKDAKLFTRKGLQVVSFILEDDIAELLEAIAKSRMKKATKNRAAEISKKYIQAGFRLQVLLEVAPEKLIELGTDKLEEQGNIEELNRQALRTKSKAVRTQCTKVIHEHITENHRHQEGIIQAMATNGTYLGLYGEKASGLKKKNNLPANASIRDNMSNEGLGLVMFSEMLSSKKIEKDNVTNFDIPKTTQSMAEKTKQFYLDALNS